MAITLDGTTGITTPGLTNTGSLSIVNFTTSGNTILGDASTDTLNVGNGGLVKDASGNVGIGTGTPTTSLTVNRNASFTGTPSSPIAGGGIHVIGADSASLGIHFDTFSNNSQITFRRANGTLVTPTALTTDSILGAVTWRGYGTTGYSSGNRGLIQLNAAENWTDTAQGTYLQFNTVAVGTTTSAEKMRLDSSGNLGLGVTPSAWGTSFGKVVELQGGAVWASSTNNLRIVQNMYYDGTNYIYKTTEKATRYDQQQGAHNWFTAPSGTAGNAITFTQAMTLDASGHLNIGITSGAADTPLYVYESANAARYIVMNNPNTGNASAGGLQISGGSGADLRLLSYSAAHTTQPSNATILNHNATGSLLFGTNGLERYRIDNKGNLQNSLSMSNSLFRQVSRSGGNATETFTATDMGMSDNVTALINVSVGGTSTFYEYGGTLIYWYMPRGSVSAIQQTIVAAFKGASTSTFSISVSGNSLVVSKDSDLAVSITIIGGGGYSTI